MKSLVIAALLAAAATFTRATAAECPTANTVTVNATYALNGCDSLVGPLTFDLSQSAKTLTVSDSTVTTKNDNALTLSAYAASVAISFTNVHFASAYHEGEFRTSNLGTVSFFGVFASGSSVTFEGCTFAATTASRLRLSVIFLADAFFTDTYIVVKNNVFTFANASATNTGQSPNLYAFRGAAVLNNTVMAVDDNTMSVTVPSLSSYFVYVDLPIVSADVGPSEIGVRRNNLTFPTHAENGEFEDGSALFWYRRTGSYTLTANAPFVTVVEDNTGINTFVAAYMNQEYFTNNRDTFVFTGNNITNTDLYTYLDVHASIYEHVDISFNTLTTPEGVELTFAACAGYRDEHAFAMNGNAITVAYGDPVFFLNGCNDESYYYTSTTVEPFNGTISVSSNTVVVTHNDNVYTPGDTFAEFELQLATDAAVTLCDNTVMQFTPTTATDILSLVSSEYELELTPVASCQEATRAPQWPIGTEVAEGTTTTTTPVVDSMAPLKAIGAAAAGLLVAVTAVLVI